MTPSDAGPSPTLRDVLRATPRLAPERVARLLDGIARALSARGAPYGALTPERVLVGAHDAVVLAPAPRPGTGAPWPAYLAPEQIDGRPGDARSDVYAMGLLGWEMLAGRQPWEGDSLYGIVVKQREQDLPRLSTLRPGLPRALVQAVEGALHKDPGDRWESPAELASMLGGLIGRVPTPEPAPARDPSSGARAAAPAASVRDALPATHRTSPMPAALAAEPDEEPDELAPLTRRPQRPPAPRSTRGTRRWLTVAVLVVAMLAAAAGAYAVVQGRQDTTATRAWLDSVTASAAAVGGAGAGAVPATTTQENTTSVPIRRAGGGRAEPEPADEDAPDPDQTPLPAEDPQVQPAFPSPPDFPRAPGRLSRPTVPRDTATVRADTLVEPPPPLRR